jgi:hypothetical protein
MHIAVKGLGNGGRPLCLDIDARNPAPDINRIFFGAVCADIT